MKYQFHRAVVIGSGTMGAAIAAHLANVGIRVTLLDIIPNQPTLDEEKKGLTLKDKAVRNRIVQEGLDRAMKSRPASFFTPEHARLITTGNLEDDFDVVSQADWVIEAIIENLSIKRILMARIDATRGEKTIVSTNTSGIPVASIAEECSPEFKEHFLGTHFFNPPRYLKLVEVIPTPQTSMHVVDAISHFLEYRLGKGVVPAKDTPNFIANRLGFGSGAFALDYIVNNGFSVEEVDAITGPIIGRPKTATFRLIDLVGIDVWEHVGKNLAPAIPHDQLASPYLNSERANSLIRTMVEKGWLGNKTRQGFYKEVKQVEGGKEFWALNLQTLEYEAPTKVRFESVGQAKDLDSLGARLKIMLAAQDRAGQLVRALTYQSLAYASYCIPEISNDPQPIDDAMRWGFGHEAGPFETWDALGVKETLDCMDQAGYPAAKWVKEMVESGHPTFYQFDNGNQMGVYHPGLGGYRKIPKSASLIVLKEQPVVSKNAGATLRDIGDGIGFLELHTKMNALDDDIFTMFQTALNSLEFDFDGLVVGTEAENFSAGANLFLVVMLAQNQAWEQLNLEITRMQGIGQRMRYSPKPVIVAPAGLALGGGAEMIMHGSRVVAGAELYSGLVEIGAGVIPAGGGTKEMLRRILNPPVRTQNAEALPFLQRIFEQIGMAKVATSAEEARQLGILNPCDRVVLNRSHLLAEAKKEVLNLLSVGYQPPIPEKIYAAGRDGLAALQVGIFMFKEGGYITEHEAVIASKLANVMAGGDISRPAWVEEQTILDLEREAFLSLCGEPKTQQRMWNLLQTGKVLRN
jgi:3-hydroxyacyl-CoA dehydrogenase